MTIAIVKSCAKRARGYVFHPLSNQFPLMGNEELQELANDIRAHGQREPLVLSENQILDGRNRCLACVEVGINPKFKRFSGSWEEARDFVISANIHRRHLTSEQKREVIALLLKANPEKSDRQIAKAVKASPTFVGKMRKNLKSTVHGGQLKKRIGADGKSRNLPSPKKPRAEAPSISPKPSEESTAASAEKRKAENAAHDAAVNAPDIALQEFDSHVLRLLQMMTKKNPPARFEKSSVPSMDLWRLSRFLGLVYIQVEARKARTEPTEAAVSEQAVA
jgi:hypothetical protein